MVSLKKNNHKKLLSKKIVWGVLLVLVTSFIAIPDTVTKASDYPTIRVLEVEPGNGFILKDKIDDTNKVNVKVTTVDMPTFISMVDDIAGSYDVVYIGRYRYSKDVQALKGVWDTDTADMYRDYSAPFKYARIDDTSSGGEKTILQGDNLGTNIVDRLLAQAYWYGTMGLTDTDRTWNPQAQNGNVTTKINGTTENVVEYYPENDITNRRAKEIIKMIESNQLVYFNGDIFNTSSGSDLNLQGTKLQSNFSCYFDGTYPAGKYPNCKKVESSKADTDTLTSQIINDYKAISNSYKRPTVTDVTGPKSDDWNATSSDTSDQKIAKRIANRNMTFSFNLTKPDNNAQYRAKLYLDYDADGIFEDNEVVPISQVDPITSISVNSGSNTINYNLKNDFVGYLDWKVEVYKYDPNVSSDINSASNVNVKTNVYGHAIYKTTGKKVNINVLQLQSNDKTYGNNLDLTSTANSFHTYVTNTQVTDDYVINITKENVATFNSQDAQSILDKYDMIILGFADCYGNVDANAFSDNGIAILNAFNAKHKSLMFTHDTMSLNVLGNVNVTTTKDKSKLYTNSTTSNKLTQSFRDIVGQSRYADIYNVNSGVTVHDSSVNDNTIKGNGNTITLGTTAYASPTLYKKSAVTDTSKCSTVKLVNKAEINRYPYDLSAYDNKMLVGRTHVQWFQLNLEDPEVVPWYNLSTDNLSSGSIYFNSGDARNFYYTYSRGNITYSGTGHTSSTTPIGGYTNEESQLFVNTIIKAARGGNQPPSITNMNADKTVQYTNNYECKTKASEPFKFNSNIFDQDAEQGENMQYKVSVDGKVVASGTVKYIIGGVYIDPVTIDSAYLSTKIGQTINVKVEAYDGYGAADTKSFSIFVNPTETDIYHGVYTGKIATTDSGWNISNISSLVDESQPTKDYFKVVPFISYINMYSADTSLTLSLDQNFSEDKNTYQNRTCSEDGTTYQAPVVYIVNTNGSLTPLGNMSTADNGKTYTFSLPKSVIDSNGSKESNANYDIVVKYYCKTYNHDTSTDGGSLKYTNDIAISRTSGNADLPASIYVGFNKLKGDLF